MIFLQPGLYVRRHFRTVALRPHAKDMRLPLALTRNDDRAGSVLSVIRTTQESSRPELNAVETN